VVGNLRVAGSSPARLTTFKNSSFPLLDKTILLGPTLDRRLQIPFLFSQFVILPFEVSF